MGLKKDIEEALKTREDTLIQRLSEFIQGEKLSAEKAKLLIDITSGYYSQGLEVLDSGRGTDFNRYNMSDRLKELKKRYK